MLLCVCLPYIESGDHEPEEEDGLEEKVEREPVQQHVGEGLKDRQEAVHRPVRHVIWQQ